MQNLKFANLTQSFTQKIRHAELELCKFYAEVLISDFSRSDPD